jgi:hypothetical protein
MSSSVKARTETTLRAGPSTEQAPTASFAIDSGELSACMSCYAELAELSDSDASDSEVSEEEWWCDGALFATQPVLNGLHRQDNQEDAVEQEEGTSPPTRA